MKKEASRALLPVFLVSPESVCAFHKQLVREYSTCGEHIQDDAYDRKYHIQLVYHPRAVIARTQVHEEFYAEPDLKSECYQCHENGSPVLEHSDLVCRQSQYVKQQDDDDEYRIRNVCKIFVRLHHRAVSCDGYCLDTE